jgi:hypothetical protein
MNDPRRQVAGVPTRLKKRVVQWRCHVPREDDQRVALQIPQSHGRSGSQRMRGIEHHAQRLRIHRPRLKTHAAQRVTGHRNVEFAVAQSLYLLNGGELMKVEQHVRRRRSKRRDHSLQRSRVRVGWHGHLQDARSARPDPPHGLLRHCYIVEHRPNMLQQQGPGFRQLYSSPPSMDQRHTVGSESLKCRSLTVLLPLARYMAGNPQLASGPVLLKFSGCRHRQ